MSKFIIIVSSLIVLGIFLNSLVLKTEPKNPIGNLSELRDKHGDRILKAIYSLEETRPFAILTLDKTIEMYENKWLMPEKIVENLSDEEKDELVKELTAYLEEKYEDNELIKNLDDWCAIDCIFEVWKEKYYVDEQFLIKRLNELELIDLKLLNTELIEISMLNDLEKNKILTNAKNNMAKTNEKKQFELIGKIFIQLSRVD